MHTIETLSKMFALISAYRIAMLSPSRLYSTVYLTCATQKSNLTGNADRAAKQ